MIFATLALGSLIAAAQASSDPSPAPTATCEQKALPLHADQPNYPDAARKRNLGNVSVEMTVDISATGAVSSVQVTKSSGDPDIDSAALDAALKSTYQPKITNCKAVPGTYLFRADFSRSY
jgi:TonB family protein